MREIAHELRNPLNALSAIMEIMKDQRFGPLGNPRYQEYAALAHDATAKMIGLCDRLVRTPQVSGPPTAVSISGLLHDIATMYRPMAEARGLSLALELQDDLPDLAIDPGLLSTVLSNLLTNAIKFTPRGGRVSLVARREPLENVAVLVVSDSGVGLDATELAHQMQAVAPESGALATVGLHGDTGSGLGLVIARRSIEEIGGTLELRSSKGMGTCAIVRLPLSLAAPAYP
ncbi:MAG: HAMP domain-containing sensor histidine kinase [Thalassobaculaceae bacterium]|nr:HAMP domain-containing sensor histidine kinase [Thalassobaculaceae bacterium]